MADPNPRHSQHSAAGSSGFGDKDDHVIERRTLRDYYIILRERLWIALPAAVLIAAGYAYLQARKPQMFRAQASMEFTPADNVVTAQGVTNTTVQSDAEMNTQIQLLNSNVLRERVYNSFTPDEIKVLQRPYEADLAAGQSLPTGTGLLGNVYATQRRGSYVVDIISNHRGSEAAALIANRFIDQYSIHRSDMLGDTNTNAIREVENALKQARDSMQKAELQLTTYTQENNLIDSAALSAQLQQATAAHENALSEFRLVDSQLRQVEEYRQQGRDLIELPRIADFGNVRTLKAAVDAERGRLESLTAMGLMYKAPPLIAQDTVLETKERELAAETDRAYAALRNLHAERSNIVQEQERRRAAATALSTEQQQKRIGYGALESERNIARDSYNDLLNRLNELTTVRDVQKVSLRKLDTAVPGYLYEPNINAIARTSIGLFLVVFFGVAIGLSFIDDRIKSAWDVEHFVGVDLLGIVPDLSSLKEDDKYTLVFNNRQVLGTEAFLGVYSSVKIHSKLDFPKAVLVTSTIPGEGKTLISCNLAGSFARHGKRTLLIDCDLRRPMVHRYFKQENTRGILTWSESGASTSGDLTTDPNLGIIKLGENFSLLCSGGRSKSPTDILENPAFPQLIDALKKHYDLVIIDSPPLGAVTDSMLIAEATDEVIYVCRFNKAYRKHIRLYVKALRNGKNEILGVVLNGLSPRRIEYYSNYRYYRSYKKYYGSQS